MRASSYPRCRLRISASCAILLNVPAFFSCWTPCYTFVPDRIKMNPSRCGGFFVTPLDRNGPPSSIPAAAYDVENDDDDDDDGPIDLLCEDVSNVKIVTAPKDDDDDGPIDLLCEDVSNVKIVATPKDEDDDGSRRAMVSRSFVSMFRGSAYYMASHLNSVIVYHIPGELLENKDTFPELMDDIALTWLLGMKIVLVVGCCYQVESRLSATVPSTPNQSSSRNSLQVTNLSKLRIVKEEAGYARFEVERQLARALRLHHVPNQIGGNVISGNFYAAQPFGVVDGVDYQYTGVMRRVEAEKIERVHSGNDIVLLTTLGFSPSGEVFHVNGEAIASGVAGAIGANKIMFLTVDVARFVQRQQGNNYSNNNKEQQIDNKNYEENENNSVHNLRLASAKRLLKHNNIALQKRGYLSLLPNKNTGEFPLYEPAVFETLTKLGWSVDALERGVKRAHIISPRHGALLQELYTRDGSGTLISRDLYEGIRPADVNDVAKIYDLVEPLVQTGTLIPRTKGELEKDIKTYYVYTRDDMIVAIGQLRRYEGSYAEIGCLVVHKDYRRGGRGDAMLGFLERICVRSGASSVFVLSTQTMEWFVERGFREATVRSLPPSKRAVYNHDRKSRIYMKFIDDRGLDADELIWDR